MPDLLLSIGATDHTQAARHGGYLVAAFSIAHLLATPVLGGLADAFGRRPLLVLGLASGAIVNLVFALAGQLWIFVLCRVFGGMSAASDLALTASLADISEPEDRARLFGYVTASNSLGMIIGPAIGGALGAIDLHAPFVLLAVCKAMLFLFAVCFIRETLPEDARRTFEPRRANPVGAIKGQLRHGLNPAYLIYVACVVFGVAGLFYVGPYYMGLRYGWGPAEIGGMLGVIAAVAVFVQTVFLAFVRRIMTDQTAILVFTIVLAVVLGLMSLPLGAGVFAALLIVVAFCGVAPTLLIGRVSAQTPANQQGEMNSALSTITSTSDVVSPLIYPALLAGFVAIGPEYASAPFVLSALFVVTAVFAAKAIRQAHQG